MVEPGDEGASRPSRGLGVLFVASVALPTRFLFPSEEGAEGGVFCICVSTIFDTVVEEPLSLACRRRGVKLRASVGASSSEDGMSKTVVVGALLGVVLARRDVDFAPLFPSSWGSDGGSKVDRVTRLPYEMGLLRWLGCEAGISAMSDSCDSEIKFEKSWLLSAGDRVLPIRR